MDNHKNEDNPKNEDDPKSAEKEGHKGEATLPNHIFARRFAFPFRSRVKLK